MLHCQICELVIVCSSMCVCAWMRACSGTSVLRSVRCVLAGRQEIGHTCGLPISATGGMRWRDSATACTKLPQCNSSRERLRFDAEPEWRIFSLGHGARRAASSERLNAETPDLMAKQGGHDCTVDGDRIRIGYEGGLGIRDNSYNITLISFHTLCNKSFLLIIP